MINKKCEYCNNELPVCKTGQRKGQLLRPTQRFCSKDCQNAWQREISWEDRIGKIRADEIRKERSEQVSGENNPSCDPKVAKKISDSLKQYLEENPRLGDKNPFYGKEHTEEYKQRVSESKKGKRSYDDVGYKKQNENTPRKETHPDWYINLNRNISRKENHPCWLGGASYGEYDFDFDPAKKKLIKERDNFVCQICECDENGQDLHIHHIDYDKRNSNEMNLITLCNSCHSKTNWRRESWLQFFKPIINEKYKQ